MKRILALFLVALFAFAFTVNAPAATETIKKTFTIASGANNGSAVVTMPNSNIKEVILTCPTLDDDDTATATLTMSTTSSAAASQPAGTTISPHGWADKSIGATDDAATFYCTTATTNIFCTGSVNFTVLTSSAQAATRTFTVYFIREY